MDFITLQRAKLHYVFENIFHVVERLVSEKEAKMNKIFKVIWSKSKQCYVVVSELAKNTTGKKKIVVASILAALMAGQAMQVEAAYGKITSSNGTGSLAISGAGGTGATASTDDAIAVGQEASATGRGGIAVGRKSNAVHNALSIGWIASATTKGAIAIGSALEEPGVSGQKEVVSDGFYSIAIGGASKSSGTTSVALGVKSSASEDSAIAIGTDATASKTSATAVGKSAEASGSEATSFGVASTANKDGALAVGSHSTSSVKAGTAIGYNASVSYSGAGDSWGATAIGAQTAVTGKNAVAIGRASKASGNNSLAIGAGNNDDGTASTEFAESTGTNSLAIGYNAKAKNISAVAVGKGAKAEGVASTALGETALADHDNDSALGNSVHASGGGSSAVGYLVTTSGNQAFGAGSNTTVSGTAAVGIGYMNTAKGNRAISIGADDNGKNNTASGDASIAIGKAANAGGTTAAASSIAIGDNAAASGVASTAVGKATLADKDNDSSFGNSSHASGGGSSAIGYLVTTSGNQAFGAGSFTTVSGPAAVGIGYSNEVTGDRAVAIGSALDGVKTGVSGNYGVAIGAASRALAEAATAIGKNTTSSGADSIVIGTAATSTSAASSAISVGKNSKTEDQNAVAIGVDSYAKTMDSIAIGNTAKATGAVSTALGARAEALGTSAVAVGINAKAKKDQATALGFSAQANEKNSVALGYSAISSQENAVALGSASTTTTNATSQGSVVIGGKTITWSGAPTVTGTGMQVSVGSVGAERQIKNVAAGEVSKTSTDAINGSQLYAVADALRTKYVSIKSSATGIGSNENNDGATDTDAIAIGPKASATKPNATALGKGAAATDSNSTAIGTGAQATGSSSVALGDSANASSSQAIAIGKSTVASQYDAVAIGNGSNATASYTLATNGGAASGLMSISVGHSTEATKENAVAVGYNSKANGESSVAISGGTTEAEKAIAIGTDAQATKEGSIAQGWKSLASSKGTVAIGGSTDGTELGAQATELYASAYGNQATASGQYSTALGNQSTASQSHATAVGHLANATADSAAAIGYNARAQGTYAFAAVGGQAIGVDTIAIGRDSVANTIGSIAQGKGANAQGGSSIAIGSAYGTNAGAATNGENAIALGAGSSSTANNALALGLNANSSATDSIAVGLRSQSNALSGVAIGADSKAAVAKGVALGAGSEANVASGVAGYNANTENIARTDKYSGLTGVALNSNLGALSVGVTDASGAATSTRQIVGVAAGQADTDAVNVAQLKSVNLAFTGNSGSGDVNLSKSQLAVEGGTDSFITTTAANKKLEINTTQGTLKNTSGTVSVDGNNGLAVAQNVADVINQANADQSIKYKANGTGSNSVKLSDGLNFTNGTTTTATVGANGQVTFDLNTATQKSITDSATAVARTISLGGDTGTTTAKSLTSSNVNFGVKSGSPTYLTTTANGNDVTLTINEQAIKNAAKDASSFKVKANATAAEDVKGGDTVVFNNGDNIAITQTGKTFKIATAKNVAFDTATIGTNTTIGSTGVSTNKVTVGNISIDGTDGINAGGKAITNVGTGRVSNSSTDDGNVANIGDVKAITNNAVANLSTSLGVTDGTNSGTVNLKNQSLKVVGTGVAKATVNGQTITVDVAKGTLTNNTTTGALTGTAGVVDANDMATAVNTAITKAVDTATGTQALNLTDGTNTGSVKLSTQTLSVSGTNGVQATVGGQGITIGLDTATKNLISNSSTAVDNLGKNTFTLKADSTDTTAQDLNKSGGLAFKVAGDGNFTSTSAAGDTVTVSVKQGVFGSNADGTAKSTTNGVATTDKVADIVNTTVSNAVNNVTSNQNLKIGGDTTAANSAVNLKNDTLSVKGDNKYISTAASGNDITLTVNEQAIKDAAKDASSFKVKANSTAAEDVKGGDIVAFNDGDNIAITQTGKTFKIATAKNVTFDVATIGGNTTIGSTGITTNKVTVGGISIDGTNGINAGSKQITNVASGGTTVTNAANIGDVDTKVTTAINDLTTNLTKNTSISYTANNDTPVKTVSLKDGFKFTDGTLTTAEVAANGVVKFNVTQGSLSTDSNGNITNTAGVATTDDVKNAVNTAINKAVTNSSAAVNTLGTNTFTLTGDNSTSTTGQALNKNGGLSFKVAGDGTFITTSAATDTVTVSIKQGTFGSNADGTAKSTTNGVATTDKVADIVNTTVSNAVNNVTSNQNLKIGGDTTAANSAVNLKNDTLSVKGDNKYISTAASGNDITLTVNEQAIKDAAKDASSFKVKANSTAAEDVKGGDIVAFNDGDNIAITQTGKTFKIATAKNVTFDVATIGGNTTIGSTGITTNKVTVGGISIDGTNGINAGSKQITNVASGGTTVTNAANIGDVDTKVTTAINDLTTNLTKNTSISYTANNDTPVKTVSLKDGFKFTDGTLTTAEVAANGVVKFNVTQGSLSTDSNGNITNTAGVATTDDVKNAVNTAINKAVTNSSAAVNTLGTNTFTLTGDNSTSTTGQALNKNGGLSFKVAGDGTFITTSAATDTVTVSIKQGTFGSNTDGTAKSTTNGVATTNDVANIVNTTVTNAVTKATGSQVLNITDGTNNDSINLKNDTLKVVGTDGVTTAVSGKTITVGLDTATKDKINNASAATNKNISLAADTGTVSSQSLKDGDVSFAVKGATGDYISTNMNGSTVEISTKRATINSNAATGEASVTGNDGLVTAKNVADAINAATAKAVSQSAWKLAADGTTGTETISGGDTVNFKAGSNMEVSRTGKDITYKTKDNVAFTTVTAGTGANEVKLDGNTGTVTAKDITATGDVTAKNVTTSGNVTAAGTVKGDTVQGNTVKAGNVTITGGTTNTITGLSNTTWTPAGGIQADRAATEGQLQQAINQVNATVGSTALTFKGDTNPAQSMTLQGNTFAITGDTMIKTTTNTNGIGLSLDTSKVNIAYAANGLNGQTTSIASGFNFTDGDHTKATVDSNGVVKYNAKTSTISVANGHAAASGNDLATADNVADAINQMTQNNSGNTTQLRQEISKVATETQRVGAHAAAMAALKPIQYDPLAPTQIMAGVGNYRGESAAALGIAHYTNDNTMFNVGVSVGGNHNMINAGVTHKFGISAEKKNIPDRYKAGPISSIYVMQDEMTQLRSENEAYKAKLDKQQSEIDALKAAVDQLLASKA